jgi:hypothetical protein
MLPQIGAESLQAYRLMTELALELDTTGTPAVRREDGAIEKENALCGHQVFILVMMS